MRGWHAKCDLAAMCRDAWNWRQKTPDGYKIKLEKWPGSRVVIGLQAVARMEQRRIRGHVSWIALRCIQATGLRKNQKYQVQNINVNPIGQDREFLRRQRGEEQVSEIFDRKSLLHGKLEIWVLHGIEGGKLRE